MAGRGRDKERSGWRRRIAALAWQAATGAARGFGMATGTAAGGWVVVTVGSDVGAAAARLLELLG